MLLLLAKSPSPARASQARRPGGEVTARVLFQEPITLSKSNGSGGGTLASASVSMLLPSPASPFRRGSIPGDPTLDPPPVRGDPFFGTPGGVAARASLFPPATPGTAKFNIADFVHFTPTPAYPASPVRSGGGGAGGTGMGMGMPPGAQLSPIASVRRASGGAKERKESTSLGRRTSTEEDFGKAKESPPTSVTSVKSVGSDAERPPSSSVSTVAEDR